MKKIKNIILYIILFWTCGCYEKVTDISKGKEENDFEIIEHACTHINDTKEIVIADSTYSGDYLDLDEITHTKIVVQLIQTNGLWSGFFNFKSEIGVDVFIMCDKDVSVTLKNITSQSEIDILPKKVFDSQQIYDSTKCNDIKKASLFEIENENNTLFIGPTTVDKVVIIVEEVGHHEHTH